MNKTKEEQEYYSKKNKRCETCKWICINPEYKKNSLKPGPPWICGNEGCVGSFGKGKKAEQGKRCKHWKAKAADIWVRECRYIRRCCASFQAEWEYDGGRRGVHHLYFIADAVADFYHKRYEKETIGFDYQFNLEQNDMDPKKTDIYIKDLIISAAARGFHISKNDVKICLAYKEVIL